MFSSEGITVFPPAKSRGTARTNRGPFPAILKPVISLIAKDKHCCSHIGQIRTFFKEAIIKLLDFFFNETCCHVVKQTKVDQ